MPMIQNRTHADTLPRYTCESCGSETVTASSPGQGHLPSCPALARGVEYLRYHPPLYIVAADGKYYHNLESTHLLYRRIRVPH